MKICLQGFSKIAPFGHTALGPFCGDLGVIVWRLQKQFLLKREFCLQFICVILMWDGLTLFKLQLSSRKYKQFTRKYYSWVVVYNRRGFLRLTIGFPRYVSKIAAAAIITLRRWVVRITEWMNAPIFHSTKKIFFENAFAKILSRDEKILLIEEIVLATFIRPEMTRITLSSSCSFTGGGAAGVLYIETFFQNI